MPASFSLSAEELETALVTTKRFTLADGRHLTGDPDVAGFLIRDIQVALAQGARGPSDDAILIYRDWGFSLNDVKMPVHIFHGTEDKLVPDTFSEYMRDHLPEATLTPIEGQRHFTHLLYAESLFHFLNTLLAEG